MGDEPKTNKSKAIHGESESPSPATNNNRGHHNNNKKNGNGNTNLKNLLAEFGFTNITNNEHNPSLNPDFNQLLSSLQKTIENYGFTLPQTPPSVMDPAFGKKSINDITELYQTVYVPAIDDYAKKHLGETDTLHLLRFFGLIQLILFKSLSMVDMFSLLRSKYMYGKVDKTLGKVSDILTKLQGKGLEMGLAQEQIKNLRSDLSTLATGVIKPVIVTGAAAGTSGSAAGQGGGYKKAKRATSRGKKTSRSKKSSKGKRSPKGKKTSKSKHK